MSDSSFSDRYEILETYAGGSGVVYKANDKAFDRVVAIKTPDSRTLGDSDRLEQFIEEGRLLAKFDHPNVLGVYNFHEVGEFDERCYIVCPWMDTSLADVLEKETLSPEAAEVILKKVLEGVRAMHNEGIVHRDLKPSNIFMSTDRNEVKIGDLGIASDLGQDGTLDVDQLTPKYHAPEILREGEKIDRRSDVYSIGMIAYEMYLGKQRFEKAFPGIYGAGTGGNRNTRWLNWHQDLQRQAPSLHTQASEVSISVSEIIDKMISKDQNQRYPDADTVLQKLAQQISGRGSANPLPYEPISTSDPFKNKKKSFFKSKWFYATVGIISILSTVAILLIATGPSGNRDEASQAGSAMKEARDAAIALGIDKSSDNSSFQQAEMDRELGINAWDDKTYDKAKVSFEQATEKYLASIDHYWNTKVEDKQGQLTRARQDAHEAGASELSSFISADNQKAQAEQAISSKQYDAGLDQMDVAIQGFQAALAEAVATKAWLDMKNVKDQVVAAGASQQSIEFKQAQGLEETGLIALDGGEYQSATESFELAKQAYEQAPLGKTQPVTVTLGSSQTEIEYAMALCGQYQDECKMEWYSSEIQREMTLSPFEIDQHEITNAEFARFVDETSYVTDAEKVGYSWRVVAGQSMQVGGLSWKSSVFANEEDPWSLPVVNVSFNDAASYCEWAGKRLPTEDEWEYAARGDTGNIFPWGNEWAEANAVWRLSGKPRPVGSVEVGATPTDIYEMSGNVWEWTIGRNDSGMVLKGGSWAEENPANLRAAARRVIQAADSAHNDEGFRCAKNVDKWAN